MQAHGSTNRAATVCLWLAVAVAAPVATAAPAVAASEATRVVDLRTEPSWLVTGVGTIAPVGDVNGDGIADAALADCGSGGHAGTVHVVWGPFTSRETSTGEPLEGFSIHGAEAGDYACRLSMVAPGDVNGDGLDDVLVGADQADQNGRSAAGAVYVVFGKADSAPVELRDFELGLQGARGYRVDGPAAVAIVGAELAGTGDMNGDGLADFVVGSPFHGAAYVVFGQSSTAPVDLRTFDLGTQGERGFRIDTRSAEATHGYSVGFAGDVNADGIPDVAIGVIPDTHDSSGSAYVVFGKSDSDPVDSTTLSFRGFRIKGGVAGEGTGSAVSAAGDVNGDGLDDVVVGAPKAYSCCRGKATVVFGKTDSKPVRVRDLGDDGFKIISSQDRDFFGREVAGIGDVNGDGLSDVAVGAPGHDFGSRGGPGAVFVVYGRGDVSKIRTGGLGDAGYTVVGRMDDDRTGTYLGVPGDVDADGVPDLMISAPTGGKTYLVWSTAAAEEG